MSASGKSSNRLYEYNRGRRGGGHGIYAEAGKRDARSVERTRCTSYFDEDSGKWGDCNCGTRRGWRGWTRKARHETALNNEIARLKTELTELREAASALLDATDTVCYDGFKMWPTWDRLHQLIEEKP